MSHQRNNNNNNAAANPPATPWQNALNEACAHYQIAAPTFQIVSDRRGGRTAWSSKVVICGQTFSARFWYDGKNLNNAKEDAAELALSMLTTPGEESRSPVSNRSLSYR
ncbi:hypothetical protein B0T25DRAFT_570525 [Lasiosphaeria hispida]|uniref:DRBM domain-containing protein n=1 Tax=Lasiosphaeria hispida TaxID=260671 RepID=A0AAJ0MCV9_9PEZI|nr:hypothetical protein B0T25DRAFT_570525 [Lasiosphaeria hispida]